MSLPAASRLRPLLVIGCLLAIAIAAPTAHAQNRTFFDGFLNVQNEARQGAGVRDFNDPIDFISTILRLGATFISILALAALLWGGVMYILALGDEDKAAKAKRIILFAIAGLAVIGVSAVVVNVVVNILL